MIYDQIITLVLCEIPCILERFIWTIDLIINAIAEAYGAKSYANLTLQKTILIACLYKFLSTSYVQMNIATLFLQGKCHKQRIYML